MRKRAFFITIEGLEGCGKSSVVRFLKKRLTKDGSSVVVFRDPGSTNIGEQIRRILLDRKNNNMSYYTELLLYLAARTQLIEEKLKGAFTTYDFVICDRFFDSTLVYQGYGLRLGDIVERAVKMFSLGIIPDLTIVLDADPRRALERIGKPDRIESRNLSFHYRLRRGYQDLGKKYPQRIVLVNADRDLRDIYKDVETIIERSFYGK